MTKDYLFNRKSKLQEKLKIYEDKLNDNMYSIVESKNKIDHLESMVDEASEIFSVRGRGDSGLNNQEINQLEVHISSYLTENDCLKDKISKLSNEISIIDACLEEISNVSRETFDIKETKLYERKENNTVKSSIHTNLNIDNNKIIDNLAESLNLIEIDKYMIRNTCAIIRRWIDSGIPVYPVSVNLSRLNLYNKRIIQDIREYVEEYQIPREYISFEITESAFSGDNSYIKILAEKLQKEHFKVLMDDFGSGYSSLNTLKEIPVDVLKIDLKFLPAGENDEKANLIIKHVVEMAVDLDLMIIVEGVEREEQVEFLTKIGCKIAQGFYYYRPISVLEYEAKVTQS